MCVCRIERVFLVFKVKDVPNWQRFGAIWLNDSVDARIMLGIFMGDTREGIL